MKERDSETIKDKHGRRGFLKITTKYILGFSAFGIASLFGLKRNGDIRLGKMSNYEVGLSEASGRGKCGSAYDCTGGGGKCGSAYDCSGGGGKCGSSYDCTGSGESDDGRGGGRGKCGSAYDCTGGGGKCGSAYDCTGGGGKCGSAYDCSGS